MVLLLCRMPIFQSLRSHYRRDNVMLKYFIIKLLVLSAMLLGLPMAGILVAGRPVAIYLEFPPETRFIQHEPFS